MDQSVVPIIYVSELVKLVTDEEGVSARRVLRGSGITMGHLNDADYLVSHMQLHKVYENALKVSTTPGLGLRLGASYRPQHHGALGHALLCAKDGQDMLRLAVQYARIRGGPLDVELTDEKSHLTLKLRDQFPLSSAVRLMAVEETIGTFSPYGDEPAPIIAPSDVFVDYPAPRHHRLYEEFIQCPVHFGTKSIEFRFPKSRLKSRPTMSNAEVAQICEERCRAILARLGKGGRTSERIHNHLVMGGDDLGLDVIAERIGMSPRTVRRRLQEEGTTYRDVVNDFRKSLALDYLETTSFSLNEIAHLLGYSDAANFNRAFRGWFNEPPAQYRQKLKQT